MPGVYSDAINAPSFSTIPAERTNAATDTNLGHRLLSAEELSRRRVFRARDLADNHAQRLICLSL